MAVYSISDLSNLTGVKTHTLRMWEKRYGLLKPRRTDTNIRFYNDADLDTLRLIQKLNRHGIRISKIAGMSPPEMEAECQKLATTGLHDDQDLMTALTRMDVTVMDNILDRSIREKGFEATLMELIHPFLDKMEGMWISGAIEQANEACFRELIKRKTIREIDLMPHHCSGPKVIMFLPQGNDQELNHLFLHYFLRRHGLCITDIGCDIDIDCAVSALQKCNFDCIILVNEDPLHWQLEKFVKNLYAKTGIPILISGKAVDINLAPGHEQILSCDNIRETIRYVSRLKENLRNHLS